MGMTVIEIRELLRQADEDELRALERSLAADTRKGVMEALGTARRRVEAASKERARLAKMAEFDRTFLPEGSGGVIVGLDEVGRGAVAGPLAVGAVVLPEGALIENLNDSKQLTPEQREAVAAEVREKAACWAVHYIEPGDIDRDGMAASLRKAFAGALAKVEGAGVHCDVVLVDGNPLGIDPRERNVVKGDAKSASIAAASVVAKVERDALMRALDSTYPHYGFSHNKGYASDDHREAIRERGITPVHRVSFCKSFMQATLF